MFYTKFYQELYESVTAQQMMVNFRNVLTLLEAPCKIKQHLSILFICHEIQDYYI